MDASSCWVDVSMMLLGFVPLFPESCYSVIFLMLVSYFSMTIASRTEKDRGV